MAKSRRGRLFGVLWLAGGIFATWFIGHAARHGDANYRLLAWGPIIFGMVLFGHSAYRWCRYKVGGVLVRTRA